VVAQLNEQIKLQRWIPAVFNFTDDRVGNSDIRGHRLQRFFSSIPYGVEVLPNGGKQGLEFNGFHARLCF
jgi:hypothetical protein